jgi:ribosomal protein S15P/S13E
MPSTISTQPIPADLTAITEALAELDSHLSPLQDGIPSIGEIAATQAQISRVLDVVNHAQRSLDGIVRAARSIVDYALDDEYDDYQENQADSHIVFALITLARAAAMTLPHDLPEAPSETP